MPTGEPLEHHEKLVGPSVWVNERGYPAMRMSIPLPFGARMDKYGTMHMKVQDERGDWVDMRAEDAERITKLLTDLKATLDQFQAGNR